MKTLAQYEYFRTKNGVLYHGDCLKIIPLIKKKIDLIYTDPPYNFKDGGGRGFYRRPGVKTIMQKIKETFGHKFKPEKFFETIKTLNHHPNLYIWTSKNNIPKYLNWSLENNYSFNILPWIKMNCPPLHKNNYHPDTEWCLFFRKKNAYFNSDLESKKYTKHWITTVNTNNPIDHPCPKPLEVTLNPIEISCPPAGVVLDAYGGSGTTAIACERLGRKWILIEDMRKHCKTSKQRITNEINQLKL